MEQGRQASASAERQSGQGRPEGGEDGGWELWAAAPSLLTCAVGSGQQDADCAGRGSEPEALVVNFLRTHPECFNFTKKLH